MVHSMRWRLSIPYIALIAIGMRRFMRNLSLAFSGAAGANLSPTSEPAGLAGILGKSMREHR